MADSLLNSSPYAKKQLSCHSCRQRKLRCNRERPCQSCLRHNRSCTFSDAPASKSPGRPTGGSIESQSGIAKKVSKASELRTRIARLESLLSEAEVSRSNAHSCDNVTSSSISLVRPDSEATNSTEPYVPSTHWASLLQEVDNIKHVLNDDDDDDSLPLVSEVPSSIEDILSFDVLPVTAQGSREDILQSFPSRAISDRLVNLFFTTCRDPCVLIFHATSFQKQYLSFWESPDGASLTFIATLLGMYTLAIEFGQRAGVPVQFVEDAANETVARFRDTAASAITVSRCTTSQSLPQWALEALILRATSLFYDNLSPSRMVSTLAATIVRLAMQGGYHRNRRETPCAGEMKKRVWAYILLSDVFVSFQNGLPRLIQEWQYDTALPSNLHDQDFDESVQSLPMSRPETELTPVLYMIAKTRLIRVFGDALDLANRVDVVSYDMIFDVDSKLQQEYTKLPPAFRMRPLQESILDPPLLRLQRYSFSLLFHKIRCVLHRRSLSSKFREDIRADASKRLCMEAALTILQYQFELHSEVQLGGAFYGERWFICSIVLQEFLFASMIICYEVLQRRKTLSKKSATRFESQYTTSILLESLEKTYGTWLIWTAESPEARKALRVLATILGKPKVNHDEQMDTGRVKSCLSSTKPINPESATDSADTYCFDLPDFGTSQFEDFLDVPAFYNLQNLTDADLEMFDSLIQVDPQTMDVL